MFTKLHLRISFLLGAFLLFAGSVVAQTAIVPALTDQSCMGTRAGRNLACTANDFTASAQFSQPPGAVLTSCVAGQTITLDVISTITSGSPDRYAAGVFFGQVANLPSLNNAANLCSLGVFPSTPSPFVNLDGSAACGDFLGNSSASLHIERIKVACTPAPGTNQVLIPYAVAWDNQAAPACTPSSLTASTNSKCVESNAGFVVGLIVQGFIKITKQTNPASTTQTFSFSSVASPSATVTPASFTLASGASQTVTFPLNTIGVRQITVTEALSAGWESAATIVCTSPSGGPAPYITVNNANRTISGNFDGTNAGAICTITNNKQTRVRALKSVPNGDTGTFNLSVISGLGTTTAPNQGNAGFTTYQQSLSGSVTLTETSGSNTSLTKYITAITCLNDETNAVITPASTTVVGTTRSATITPPANTDSSCTFINTRSANIAVSKSNAVNSLVAGRTTSYTITVTNGGPSDGDGSVLKDPLATGLSCTQVTCTGVSGGAACPASASVTIAALQGVGISLPVLPANSTVTFSVVCGVTATGL